MAAFLALAAMALASSARVYFQATRNTLERQRAQDMADVGIHLALRTLANAPESAGAPATPIERTCQLPEGEVLTVAIRDEAGKIDLNTADDELLRALLTGVGVTQSAATAIIAAITDYRDADSDITPNGAEAPQYAAAARLSGPKNAPFDAVVEVGAVLGVTDDVFARISPHLTVHSGQNGIDPSQATAQLLEILARAGPDRSASPTARAAGSVAIGDTAIPARFVTASTKQTMMIHAEATTPAGTRVARFAIVTKRAGALPHGVASGSQSGGQITRPNRTSAAAAGGRTFVSYGVLQWDHAAALTTPRSPAIASAALPPC
jgi:general secretion pathway protein K